MAKHSHSKGPGARSTFVCGTTALLFAQACAQDLRPPTADEFSYLQNTVTDGRESLLPVVDQMAEVANEDNVFGFEGRGGYATFKESLHKSADRLDAIVEAEQISVFDNPDYFGAAFFRDHDGKHGSALDALDLIAYNLAFLVFCDPTKDFNDPDGRSRAGYATSIHESSHEWAKHSNAVIEGEKQAAELRPTVEEDAQLYLIQERDFAFLVGMVTLEIENLREDRYISELEMEFLWQKLNGSISTLELRADDGLEDEVNEIRESWREFLAIIATPEGYANYTFDVRSYSLMSDYWNIAEEEQIRSYSESGWYEDHVEERMLEYVSEARRELGLEFQEGELREIDFENLSEWRTKIQAEKAEWESLMRESNQELDGYNQEQRGGMKRL